MASLKQKHNIEQLEYLAQAYRELAQIVETAGTTADAKIACALVHLRQTSLGWLKMAERHKAERTKPKH